MSDLDRDPILVALALAFGAVHTLLDGAIAAGLLVAQLLDVIAGRRPQRHDNPPPPPPPAAEPERRPVVITDLSVPVANVHQLRQMVRQLGVRQWWTLNRRECLAALAAGGAA